MRGRVEILSCWRILVRRQRRGEDVSQEATASSRSSWGSESEQEGQEGAPLIQVDDHDGEYTHSVRRGKGAWQHNTAGGFARPN